MATIEELENAADRMFLEEGAALIGLIAALRELAVGLPDGSRLALELAHGAKRIERVAHARADGLDVGEAAVAMTASRVAKQQIEDWLSTREAE